MKLQVLLFLVNVIVLPVSIGRVVAQEQNFLELSGELTRTLTAERPYRVVGDIYVSPGSTIAIEAGTVLLFSSFTGLHVQGTLYAKGTASKPILFTSLFDSVIIDSPSVAAAPFDWNGVDVYDGAVGTEFVHCSIRYSVYGIRSQTEYLKIVESLFSDNGKADFTIKEERKETERGIPFSYRSFQHAPQQLPSAIQLGSSTSGTALPTDPAGTAKRSRRSSSSGIQVLRYAGLLVGMGCGAYAGLTYITKYQEAADAFAALSEPDELVMRTKTSADWQAAKKNRDTYLTYTAFAAGGAVLGLLAFSVSFAF